MIALQHSAIPLRPKKVDEVFQSVLFCSLRRTQFKRAQFPTVKRTDSQLILSIIESGLSCLLTLHIWQIHLTSGLGDCITMTGVMTPVLYFLRPLENGIQASVQMLL